MPAEPTTAMIGPILAAGAAILLLSPALQADGPGAYRQSKDRPVAMSEQNAIDAYNAGYALIERADHAENLAAASKRQDARDAAKRDARRLYLSSLEKFAAAIRFDASMHEAFTYMGYANRKLGRYPEALQAYGQALHINPDYPYAIEYQAEAFLGMNRIEEARFSYLRLYALDPKQADKLLQAIQSWLDANRDRPPAGLDVDALTAWIDERRAASALETANNPSSSW